MTSLSSCVQHFSFVPFLLFITHNLTYGRLWFGFFSLLTFNFMITAPLEIYFLRKLVSCSILILPAVCKPQFSHVRYCGRITRWFWLHLYLDSRPFPWLVLRSEPLNACSTVSCSCLLCPHKYLTPYDLKTHIYSLLWTFNKRKIKANQIWNISYNAFNKIPPDFIFYTCTTAALC